MTLRQFAKTIGYSPSTVSKAFSGASDVKTETRNYILNAAKELGILEKFYKKMPSGKTIAVIVPEFNSGLYLNMVTALSVCLKKQGAVAQFSESGFSEQTTDELISYYCSEHKADGIIVIGVSGPAKKYSAIPIVYFGKSNDPFADSVYSDCYTGVCDAVFNFKLNGHKNIAFIGETNTRQKETSFKNALKFYGMPEKKEYIVRSELRHESAGIDGMKRLLSLETPPTAFIAAYDNIALGAMAYAKEQGFFAPRDFSIVGMDNSNLAANPNISLSSVDYNFETICDLLVSRLMNKIKNPNAFVNQKTEVKSSLAIRNSIGACPENAFRS